jgi:DNA-binding HxlR family transcriptional regulator
MSKTYSQDCPVARTLDVVGDRWTLLILRDLFMGVSRFSEFQERSPGLPPKVLSSRLKELKDRGFVDRRIYNLHPLRAEYLLTEQGRTLLPIILAIGRWGLEHKFEGEPEVRDRVARAVYEAIPESRTMMDEAGMCNG